MASALEEMAREAAEQPPPPERYVPASQPVPPMYPTPPVSDRGVYNVPIPSALEDRGAYNVPITEDRGTSARIPPPPFPPGAPTDSGGWDPVRHPFTDPMSGEEVRVPPGQPPTSLTESLGPAISAIGRIYTPVPSMPSGAPTSRETPFTPSPAVTPTPAAPEPPPKSEEPAAKPAETKPQRGHAGQPASALKPREESEYPPVNDRMKIDPYYLVNLEKTNPALHDSIVQAATAAGVSSGALANLVYAASNGDPNYRSKDGRIGLTGLTQEDIDNFKQNPMTAPLFVGPDGQPVTTIDPVTNLLLGAKKYRDMADKFGERTPAAIIANYLGDGRTAQLGNMTDRAEQAKYATPEGAAFLAKATDGPNAKLDTTSLPSINPTGTNTAMNLTKAAMQSAQSGDPQPFATAVANGAPRGSTGTDAWRHTEALMVAAQIAKGDMVGAQHARELVFQMSHVGAVQSLMRGLQLMGPDGKGDLVGAAQQFAKAYWYTPDGFMARIYVTDKGLMGERFHEATGQPVGGRFMITPQLVQGMINQTTDPQAYLKTLRDSLKLSADIDETHAKTRKIIEGEIPKEQAQTGLYEAQTGYYKERAGLEEKRMDNIMDAKLLEIQRKLTLNPNDLKAQQERSNHLDAEQARYFPEKNAIGEPIELSDADNKALQVWRHIMMGSRPGAIDGRVASTLARNIVAGKVAIGEHPGGPGIPAGSGFVLNKPKEQGGTPTGIILTPTTMALLRRQVPPPPPGAAPAVSAPAR